MKKTATEVQLRVSEANKRFPVPDFSSAIYDLARRVSRVALFNALQGSREDRFKYCVNRAAAKPTIDLTCYGTAVYDLNEISELAARWFFRLERLADQMKKIDAN